MEVVPVTVGQASRAWDEQNLDVTAAAGQIGGAPTGGFTAGVSGTASRFATTWQRHTTDLAARAEAEADSLRSTISDYLRTDQAVGGDYLSLSGFLTEVR